MNDIFYSNRGRFSSRVAGLALVLVLCGQSAAGRFLWRLEGDRNHVYLLGAVHVLREDAALPAPVEKAYGAAETVVFETDLDELESVDFAQRLVRESRLPSGITLRDRLKPDTFARLQRVAAEMGIPVDVFRNQKPSMVAFALVVPHLKRLDVDPEHGVDARLWRRAGKDGKDRDALESSEFQLSLLTDLPPSLQEDLLLQTLEEIDVFSANVATMLEQWQNGDAEGLARLVKESFRGYPDVERVFLTDRNRRWVTRIEEFAREPGDVLVVVGAGHLVGYDGVVELLRILGHRVDPL